MTNHTKYVPRGRTDESSYDYTDFPAELASRFGEIRLERALDEAAENDDDTVTLKFDYEEYVPVAAIREALKIARRRGW